MERPANRRSFLKTTAALGLAMTSSGVAASASAPLEIEAKPLDTVRLGLVGVGDRGTYLLNLLLGVEGVEVRAVCDPLATKAARAQSLVEERRQPKPDAYTRGEEDYLRLCQREDLDLVVNATPWQFHTPVCLAALKAGKHVATEVPAALSVDECWQQVEAAEQAKRHCVMLENYCYQRDVMMILRMVREGLFGEVVHAEGGYQKDGRDSDLRMNPDGSLGWQAQLRTRRRGNTFPTHDAGPLAQWMNIHRGDRFDYLVSMGGNARALNEYGLQHFGPNHAMATTRFDMADVNVCLLRTVKGRTAYLLSDTLLSRPQPRNVYRLLGSKGIFDQAIDKLYLEEKSPKRDRSHGDWDPVAKYYPEFEHPLWKALRAKAIGTGRGGGDYLCVFRLIDALRRGRQPDMDVYDAAAWSSIVELSERSARERSRPIDFPDFTRGRWQTRQPEPIPGG